MMGQRMTGRSMAACLATLVFLATVGSATAQEAKTPEGYKVVYEQSFDSEKALADFEFTNPAKWIYTDKGKEGGAIEFLGGGGYKAPVRSPGIIGLVSGKKVGDFVLEVNLLQTGREYGHRDMCLFFGFQDPSHFYYVHMAKAADPNAHNVFIVNGKPRTNIAKKTTKGIEWGQEKWHKIRLERTLADGAIRVYFDDMTKPIMVAEDKTFGAGGIGFGSFDDSGRIDNIRLLAPSIEKADKIHYKKK